MIRGFEMGADFVEGERGGFEFSTSIENSLVHEVSTPGISAGAERVNREGANLPRKFDNTDVSSAGHTIPSFLSTFRRGVKSEDSAVISIHTTNSKTRPGILKVLIHAFVEALQAIELAPGDFPRPKIALECVEHFCKCGENIQILISRDAFVPKAADSHCDRVVRAAMIPAREFVIDLAQARVFS